MDNTNAGVCTIAIAGCVVTFASYEERLRMVDAALAVPEERTRIGYANAHTIVSACKDGRFRAALSCLSIVFADGAGVYAAASHINRAGMRHQPTQNATDFNERILEYADARRLRLFLVGGTDEVIGRSVELVAARYPGILLAGVQNGYFDPADPSVIDRINAAGPQLVLVGMGHPVQELWIQAHSGALQAALVIAVGGFFDFFSGRHARAPLFMRRLRLEWLHRLLLEPRRLWKRYVVGIPHFFYIVGRGEKK